MPDIDSNITFENGKIAKCVLKIADGKTFTVTLGNKGYEVKEEGTVTVSESAAKAGSDSSTSNSTPGAASTKSANSTKSAASTSTTSASTPSAPLQPGQENKYDTQEELIKTLGSYGYTAPQ